jgi:hypothetical protein
MNKAFVKEPEPGGSAHCPRCGSLGLPVSEETLGSHLVAEARQTIASAAWFCPFPTCDVVYFDAFDRTVGTAALVRPVYPKDPDAPICGCFGLTCDDIDQDLREGTVHRVRAIIEKAQGPDAQCSRLSASGSSCVSQVQGYYMKRRMAQGAG